MAFQFEPVPDVPEEPCTDVCSLRILRQRDQRLRAMKELVAHLAHSFNNSLAPLAGYLNLLGDEVRKGSPGEHYLGKIEVSMRKAETLISAMVHATHPERQFMPRPTDLVALLRRASEASQRSFPPGTSLVLALELESCVLPLDEPQWTKVIQHLLENAQSALMDSGTITVRLQQQILTPEEAAELGLQDTEVYCLSIEDNGCGMDQEVLSRVCEPLFTTRPHGPTAGLGLTLAHSVVQLHGGQIAFESPEQAGTRVRIWLPAA